MSFRVVDDRPQIQDTTILTPFMPSQIPVSCELPTYMPANSVILVEKCALCSDVSLLAICTSRDLLNILPLSRERVTVAARGHHVA